MVATTPVSYTHLHGKRHLVVVVLAEIRVQLHIIEKIMHPAHVPLERKAQAVVLRLARHLGPGRGFLRDHPGARIPAGEAGRCV